VTADPNIPIASETPNGGSLDRLGSAVAPVNLAKRIRWLREQRGQTRGEFAKMIGVSLSLVSLWEDEKRTVSVPHLMKMGEAGGISLDFMCNSQLLPTFKMPDSKPKRRKRVAAQPNGKLSRPAAE
jgi:transcriptional regulator with XRE-family HTH domain